MMHQIRPPRSKWFSPTRFGPIVTAVAALSACGESTSEPTVARSTPSVPELAWRAVLQEPGNFTLTGSSDNGTSIDSLVAEVPVASASGIIEQTIDVSWDAALRRIAGAPVYPQGWDIEYYAGASLLESTPTTAQGWATVSRIKVVGAFDSLGADGGRQFLTWSVIAPPPVIAAQFQGGSAGDGWDAFFDPDHTKVFNIHHLNVPPTVMCRNLADSQPCDKDATGASPWPVQLTQTPSRSTGYIDPVTHKLWVPTTEYSGDMWNGSVGKLGWDCVDILNHERCRQPLVTGQPDVLSQYQAGGAGISYDNHSDWTVVGRKLYALGYAVGDAGNKLRITCLDLATETECAGVEVGTGDSWSHGIDAIGNNLYVVNQDNGTLSCWDSATMTTCAAPWPAENINLAVAVGGVAGGSGRVHATPSADGIVRNICADWRCFKADGSASDLPAGYLAYASANRTGGWYSYYYSNSSHQGTRVAWLTGQQQMACWNMATDAKCSDAFPVATTLAYSAKFDPEDDNCIWTNGDDGIIRNYRIDTGVQGCGGGPPRIQFKASVVIPRLGCSPSSRVYEYRTFQLNSPAHNATPCEAATCPTYTSAKLTVKDSNGAPIAGWISITVPDNGLIDISALTPAIAGDTPTFDIAATGFTDTTVIPAAVLKVVTGTPPQVCWDLHPPLAGCPNVAGVPVETEAVETATQVTGNASYKIGETITNYTMQTYDTSGVPASPTIAECGATINGTVRGEAGEPVIGAVAQLVDGSGAAIMFDGAPATATTGTDGTFSFSVWGGPDYQVTFTSSPAGIPVSATVTAGGSGTTMASGGALTSNPVSPEPGGTGTVDVIFQLCGDGAQDGDETDVDCGGKYCGKCDGDQHCNTDTDCVSGTCLGEGSTAVCTFVVSIDNSDGTTPFHQGGVAVVVDPNVIITGGGTLDGATISINQGFAAGQDVLAVTTANGVTASYDAAAGVLRLSGTATTVQYQAILRTVTYRNTNAVNPTVAKRIVTFTLGKNSLYFEPNGHFYEYVQYVGGDDRTWETARAAAKARHYFGLRGYLVTVSDAAENGFVQSKITGQGWMGASDAEKEGMWRWVTGPEGMEDDGMGRYFFQQTANGSGGTAIDGYYHAWAGGEPNQAGNEDYAHFYTNGLWSDYETTNPSIQGYVVEFGGMPGDSQVAISDSKPVSIETCVDGKQNGDETDLDCGGATCAKCEVFDGCSLGRDCVTGVCGGGTCQAPTCTDKVQNGRETGVDCGAGCPGCGTGEDCNVPSDCVSGVCNDGTCAAPTCADHVMNGSETGVDCGGTCEKNCEPGDGCNVGGDCTSGVCTNHVCQLPTCVDAVMNGNESDVDCGGGACKACVPGDDCGVPSDCTSNVCTNHVCAIPTCTDGVRNGDESDKDCGGSCTDCKPGDHCGVAEDCDSGVCPITHVCSAPSCFDGVRNGNETARDCGGSCGPCNVGDGCSIGNDCSSGVCKEKLCQESVCGDGVIQAGETCDDGDLVTVTVPTIDGDGCSHVCLVEPNWKCDPSKEAEGGNIVGPSVCTEICGDAAVVPNGEETCDDGNTTAGDGCNADCEAETGWSCPIEGGECAPVCGDGKFQTGVEGCDDGNTTDWDGCSATCAVEPGWSCGADGKTCTGGCGDGRVGATEGCDDGGAAAGDGCSAACQVEAGWDCTGTTASVCTDDKDHDGIKTADDNCPEVANATQTNSDGDDTGDACDSDDDNDDVEDATDNCPLEANTTQVDTDKDGKGDACDEDPDQDGDGADNFLDNCPAIANPDQADEDEDGVGDFCDDDYVAFKASGNGCATGGAGGAAAMWLGLASLALMVRGRKKRQV